MWLFHTDTSFVLLVNFEGMIFGNNVCNAATNEWPRVCTEQIELLSTSENGASLLNLSSHPPTP
jgi:hypothetical protein